jgi:5-methylcytosine-specific restriction endonuclease McrA
LFIPKDNEKARAATKKYRKENAEVYKANHRLHQYKRRTKMEASSDGTLTQAFLETLYRTLFCSYCFKYTVESDRTLDHVVPLSKGGLHSASNAVMACRSCNCSKRDKLVNVK